MEQKLPIRIEKCPIIDVGVDIRFFTTIPQSAVFGLIYESLRMEYPGRVDPLPILQFPEQIRAIDPNLKFKAHYKLENQDFVLQVGPDVLVLSSKNPYVGWNNYMPHIISLIERLLTRGIIQTVSRLGIRYINLFEIGSIKQLNLDFSINENKTRFVNTHIRTEVPDGDYTSILQVAEPASFTTIDGVNRVGTLVDIDTCRNYNDTAFIQNYIGELEMAHKCEKTLFYSLLKPEFLKSLNPIYDDK